MSMFCSVSFRSAMSDLDIKKLVTHTKHDPSAVTTPQTLDLTTVWVKMYDD